MKTTIKFLPLLGALAAFVPGTLFAQGDPAPSGPPGATMRTLLQIEPRTPISSLPFNITNAGAYYLTSGLSGSDGITIAADNVDLDLMGFALTGAGGTNSGVAVPGRQINVTIRNGVVKNWGGFGINATNVSNGQLERLRASSNFAGGLAIGNASQVNNCQAISNALNGITVGDGSGVKDCYARTNGARGGLYGSGITGGVGVVISGCATEFNGLAGIFVGDNSTINGSSAVQNCFDAPFIVYHSAGGIITGDGSTVIGCTANGNPRGGTGTGIQTGKNSTIRDCTANRNGTGIAAGNNCNVQACTTCENGSGSGFGIAVGDNCIIRGCVANDNTYDGLFMGSHCLVVDNVCLGSADDPDILMGGSHNAVLRNLLAPNDSGSIGGFGTNNAIGTVENYSSLNTNKNPHANIAP